VLAARPARGIVSVVATPHVGGQMARRLLLGIIGQIPAAALLVYGGRRGWFTFPVAAALLVATALAEALALILIVTNRINRDDAERRGVEGELRRSEERYR